MAKKSKNITSAAALAKRLGVHRSTITRWMRESTWSFGNPPWPMAIVEKSREWERANGAARDAESGELRQLRKQRLQQEIKNAQARGRREEMDMKERLREVVPLKDFSVAALTFASDVQSIFQKIAQTFPGAIPIIDEGLMWARENYRKTIIGLMPAGEEKTKLEAELK